MPNDIRKMSLDGLLAEISVGSRPQAREEVWRRFDILLAVCGAADKALPNSNDDYTGSADFCYLIEVLDAFRQMEAERE